MKHMLWMVIGLAVLVAGCASNAEHNAAMYAKANFTNEAIAFINNEFAGLNQSPRVTAIGKPDQDNVMLWLNTIDVPSGDEAVAELRTATEMWCIRTNLESLPVLLLAEIDRDFQLRMTGLPIQFYDQNDNSWEVLGCQSID